MPDELTDGTGHLPPVSLSAWTCRRPRPREYGEPCGTLNHGSGPCTACGHVETKADDMGDFGRDMVADPTL